jgi:hypothetical protein
MYAAAVGGRPDVMKLVKEVYASWRAEVVFITSNRQGNQEIMEGCKEAGIPAFVCKAHGLRLLMANFVRVHRERCGTSDETPNVFFILNIEVGGSRQEEILFSG